MKQLSDSSFCCNGICQNFRRQSGIRPNPIAEVISRKNLRIPWSHCSAFQPEQNRTSDESRPVKNELSNQAAEASCRFATPGQIINNEPKPAAAPSKRLNNAAQPSVNWPNSLQIVDKRLEMSDFSRTIKL